MLINMKKFCFIITLLLIVTLLSSTNESHAKENQLKFEKNSALALNYHRVRGDSILDKILYYGSNSKELKMYSVSEKKFEQQIKWLKAHDAHFLTEKELLHYKAQGKFPPRSVWINFDDMDTSIYQNAFPILKKYNVPATGFVITSKVGAKNYHNLNLISFKHLKIMKESGLWEFRSHTSNLHRLENNKSAMAKSSPKKLTQDIKQSNQYLRNHFDENNQSIAYPYGQIASQNIPPIKKSGIKYGYILEDAAVTPNADNYLIPRILINDDSFDELIRNWKGFKDE
ncbi:polysaccharide intercellular adhesin (PIA) biosynthesis deacetylase IcaB [Staphylococcus caeli]|uniref:Poly-beta-1,6-N-acetyl-D-glucosamine N-deacetylase n=1 Tax=Staphylococcus caeli TaxID=2201815 RepID=A0A1D4LN86_9STAP|nr:intercellular adhesin biosynthesis polysaccharide N-deacetylase [Staphylococcus caeli]SCS65033.1 polysaccharide intercellular adhesin (PIA) biosynthesis deacetylase IcaB [Staphylococcus caeli]SCS87690.1 polysaccharide intercellular adhesin (PIA) biosynthesis deacetylase IcaB [Staphylococcus caeli]